MQEPYNGEHSIGVVEVAGDECYCQDGVAAEKASYLDTTNNFESALEHFCVVGYIYFENPSSPFNCNAIG